jgi:hypothetical protein
MDGYPAHEIEATVSFVESRPVSSITAQDVTLSQAQWPAQSLEALVAGSVTITNPSGATVSYTADPALADPGDGNTYTATYTVSIADSADVIGSSASAKLTIENFVDNNNNNIKIIGNWNQINLGGVSVASMAVYEKDKNIAVLQMETV